MLDDRKAAVLSVLVEEYISTGEPVSSRAIGRSGGLSVSTATIRNELVSLENDGFVHQPHTSAGRVPTDLGYRYYIDHLQPGRLRAPTKSEIEGFFDSMHEELGDLLQQTTDLLSHLTHFPAVLMGPAYGHDRVHAVHLVATSRRTFLAVLITDSGRVIKELGRLRHTVAESDLAEAERFIHRVVAGLAIDDAVAVLEDAGRTTGAAKGKRAAKRQDTAKAKASVAAVVRCVAQAIDTGYGAGPGVFIGGTSRLASLWEDLAKVHSLLEALERQALVMALFRDERLGTAVRLGTEIPDIDDDDFAIVSTGFAKGGKIGVLGPKRMGSPIGWVPSEGLLPDPGCRARRQPG
ncbi:MAG: heat-inducible transcriptional repressor HrcA [Acidimicrobiia bacterium]